MANKKVVLIAKEIKTIYLQNKLKNWLSLLKIKIKNVNHTAKAYIIIS
jgi:hypothetical protein